MESLNFSLTASRITAINHRPTGFREAAGDPAGLTFEKKKITCIGCVEK